MDQDKFQKPGIEEWLRVANVVIERLTDCVHVYKKAPEQAVFMPESVVQEKAQHALTLLHRIHALVDKSETPSDYVRDAHAHDEQVIDGIALLFRETVDALPSLSEDMQTLLNSPWQKKFPNKVAEKVFLGEGDETEGIGSGYAEHGRLPACLTLMLERELMGDSRRPREALLRHAEPRRHDVETRQRWNAQNSRFLRTAGRVE